MKIKACLVLVVLLSFVESTRAEVPPVFKSLDFQTASENAKRDGKLLILDAMTSWCGPCKRMDKVTWQDPALVKWVEAHAVAIQLDMDEHERIKDALRISAFPTVVVFQKGSEFDRVVGFQSADEMKTWLSACLADETKLDLAKKTLEEAKREGVTLAPNARLRLVGELIAYEDYETATEELVELWTLARQSTRKNNQLSSRCGSAIQTLVSHHEPARTLFTQARDQLTPTPNERDSNRVHDWLTLNSALREEAHTIAWAKRATQNPEGTELVRKFPRLFSLLVQNGEWRAAGISLVNPIERARDMGESLGAYDLAPSTSESSTPGTSTPAIPMIPMGGMKPAQPGVVQPATSSDRKSIPAIPLGGMKPATPRSVEEKKASEEKEAPQSAAPKKKSIPAIPLGGMKPAKPRVDRPTGEGRRSIPAIPLGGMKPATPVEGKKAEVSTPATPRPQSSPEEVAKEVRRRLTVQFRRTVSDYYAALLSAKRFEEADRVAAVLLQYADDGRARAALVEKAIQARVLDVRRDQHLSWINEAANWFE